MNEKLSRNNQDYVRGALKRAHEAVWQYFPDNFQPNTLWIKHNTFLGTPQTVDPPTHPSAYPDTEDVSVADRGMRQSNSLKFKVHYDPHSRYITFNHRFFADTIGSRDQFFFAACGADISQRLVVHTPRSYTMKEAELVQAALNDYVSIDLPMETTSIWRTGFRKRLIINGFFICELPCEYPIDIANELFPLIFSFVTVQALRFGNLDNFRDALELSSQHLLQNGTFNSPFYRVLIALLKKVDYIDALTTLLEKDVNVSAMILDAYGDGVYPFPNMDLLIQSYKRDPYFHELA